MLKQLNLYVINKIFTEVAQISLSAKAQMVYLNCLTHYFKDKEHTEENCQSFTLEFADHPKLENYKKEWEELQIAGLVVQDYKCLIFRNAWITYIKRPADMVIQPQNFIGAFEIKSFDEFKIQLLNNDALRELCAMKYKVIDDNYERLVELFLTEQKAFDKKYINSSDLIKHFSYWIPHNAQKNVEKKKPKLLGE
jgi:hypothetical protein